MTQIYFFYNPSISRFLTLHGSFTFKYYLPVRAVPRMVNLIYVLSSICCQSQLSVFTAVPVTLYQPRLCADSDIVWQLASRYLAIKSYTLLHFSVLIHCTIHTETRVWRIQHVGDRAALTVRDGVYAALQCVNQALG